MDSAKPSDEPTASSAEEPAAAPSRADLRRRLDAATTGLDAPLAAIDLDAWDANAADLLRRADGTPIRLATKSVRHRGLIRDALGREGIHGVLTLTLPEAIWLVAIEVTDDAVVGYPTVDRGALARLTGDDDLASRITIMVDDVSQLDLVDAVAAPGTRPEIRVCLELDCAWQPFGRRSRVGAWRSPLRTPAELAALARAVAGRRGFRLVGVMAYDAQVAGVPDRPPGRPVLGRVVRTMQRLSWRELVRRRAAAIDAVRQVAELEFVNGGGTGSVDRNAADPVVTEIAAGSGLLAPRLFDGFTAFDQQPAAFFALPVVRRPAPGVVTVLGGGYVASGAAGVDKLPTPWLPDGLRLDPREGAGETQTPLHGPAADTLAIGDRVWFRHAKAGELAERFDLFHFVRGERLVETSPTYRGDGKAVL